MKVYISKRAKRDAERLDAWWREHRDAQNLFAEEFDDAIEVLETDENPGSPWPSEHRKNLRRLRLPKTRTHLYFEIFPTEQVVRLLCVWGAPREREPKL